MTGLITLRFEKDIRAPREKVWQSLWSDDTYGRWTSVFAEGSYMETDWREGSKVLFLSPSGDGMHSEIARLVPNEFVSFRHISMIKDGQPESGGGDAQAAWSGATENYLLQQEEEGTRLVVDMQATEESKPYFEDVFPRALQLLKALAEE